MTAIKTFFTSENTQITFKQWRVLHAISLGKTSTEIADEFMLSFHTVNTYRKKLMIKLDVTNTAMLVRRGFELGLLEPSATLDSVSSDDPSARTLPDHNQKVSNR
ncbi:MAG: LuxR C-terminal-related transcriptional regulator [Bacteroidota bacterium]